MANDNVIPVPPALPHAGDMERAVLGAMLLERDSQDVVMELVTDAEVFYLREHRAVFRAIRTLYDAGAAIDLMTVCEQLGKLNLLEVAGGVYAVVQLAGSVLSSGHVEHHARLLVEKYMLRRLISETGTAFARACDPAADPFDLVDGIIGRVAAIAEQVIHTEPERADRIAATALREMHHLRSSNITFTGVDTGFARLNDRTGGWQKTDLLILAARPSVGKTSFAISLALNAALAGAPVAIFSLEMGREQMMRRMMAVVSGVELYCINNPRRLSDGQLAQIQQAHDTIAALPLYIDDTAGLTWQQLRVRARRLQKKHGLQLLVVDYLQLMENADRGLNREQQVSQNSRKLKLIAKELRLPVLALSQLNRSVESEDREPRLSDLRDSGAIEQDADIVMFLSRPSAALVARDESMKDRMLLSVAKGRNIGLGLIPLHFASATQRWSDAHRQPPQRDSAGDAPF